MNGEREVSLKVCIYYVYFTAGMDISELKRIENPGSIRRHPWELARAKALAFLLGKKGPYRHLIDAGSGDAFVLQQLAHRQLATHFTAVDTAYTPAIIEQLNKNVPEIAVKFVSGIDQVKTISSTGNAVLLADVLEHCEDDKAVLQSIVQHPATGQQTVFLITVPAYGSLFSQHDQVLGHFRRYSVKQLKQLCSGQGLKTECAGYFFFSLLIPRLIQLLLEKLKWRRVKKTIDNWQGNRLFTRLFSAILWADFRISYALAAIGIRIPGLSCYCLCSKLPS